MHITVVIPLFNKKNSIIATLDSVFKQTYLPKEIIIVNDGSTDGSEKLVEELNNPLIQLFNQTNAGVSAARNTGIQKANGDWIAFLDADDEWEDSFLLELKMLHDKYSAKVLFSNYKYVCADEERMTDIKFSATEGFCHNYFRMASAGSPPIWTGAVIVEKEALIDVGLFPEDVKIGEDLITWAKLASKFKIAYTNKVLSNYSFPIQIDSANKFRLPDSKDIVGQELKTIYNLTLEDSKKEVGLYIAHWYKMRMHLYAHHGFFKNSFKEYLKLIRYNPFNYKATFIIPYYIISSLMKLTKSQSSFK